jgi:phenylalanyl-tRNA synthetase beta chain
LFPEQVALHLSNPISADLAEMRVSLWPGLIKTCADNLRRQQPRVRLFEAGNKFVVTDGVLTEVATLAGIACGARWPEQWGAKNEPLDFYDVKADLEAALALSAATTEITFTADTLSCLRPGRSARIRRGDNAIGWLGELHPQHVKRFDLTYAPYVFELEIERAMSSNLLKYKDISKFPSVRRDIAVVVDESLPLAELRENVTFSASGLLRELRVFDVYRGPGIDSGRKSIALGLILQDSSRTLTDHDADEIVAAVVRRLRENLSATIRD